MKLNKILAAVITSAALLLAGCGSSNAGTTDNSDADANAEQQLPQLLPQSRSQRKTSRSALSISATLLTVQAIPMHMTLVFRVCSPHSVFPTTRS